MKNSLMIMLNVLSNKKEGDYIEPRCSWCKHRREVPGNCHIACAKPCVQVTGHPHGIDNGWFMYPLLFDPVWMTTPCTTYESAETVSLAVSDAVSRENA